MNTKVDTGPNIAAMLDGLDRGTQQLTGDIRRESRACLSTVSYYIAQQDATIARMREALNACIDYGSMTGDEWVTDKARAALNQEKVK